MVILSTLILIASVAATGAFLGQAFYSFIRFRSDAVIRNLQAAGLTVTGYLLLLALFSVFSRSEKLPVGKKQCFDGLCATVLRAVVEDSQVVTTVRFDNDSKYPTIKPSGVRVLVVDAKRHYLLPANESGEPLVDPIEAGFPVTKGYRFFLPRDAAEPKIEVSTGDWYTQLLIGHPNSPFHGRPVTPVTVNPDE